MATSEILGLFQTPDQYAAAQDAEMQRQFLQRATLDPFQKASVLGQQAGYSAAQGIGGALGGKDPQLEMISRRNVLLGQLNPSDPASYARVAEAASKMGDSQFAVAIAQEGRKAASEIALARQRDAAAGKERQMAVNPNIQIANEIATYEDTLREIEALPDSAERNRAKNLYNSRLSELRRLTTKDDKEKYSAFGQGLIDAGLTPGTEPFTKRMNEYLDSKVEGSKKGSGNVSIGAITVDSGAASKEAGKIIGGNVANIEQQYSLQTAYKDAASLLNQGIYGGAFGPEKQFVAKYAGVGDPKKVRNTEVFMANIGEIVIPRLQQFGGNDSNEELKYLQNVVAGNQRLEPESMKRILASAEKKVEKNIERLRLQTEAGKVGAQLPITPVTPPSITPTKRLNVQTGKIETITGE